MKYPWVLWLQFHEIQKSFARSNHGIQKIQGSLIVVLTKPVCNLFQQISKEKGNQGES